MCPEGAGGGCLPERSPAEQARADEATLQTQGPLAAARLAALRATPDGRRLLAASERAAGTRR